MYQVDRTIKLFSFKPYRNAHLHARHNTDKQAHSEFAKNTVHICMPGINTNKQAHSEKNLCQVKQQSEPKYGNPENSCAQK